jgi:hypothetical protein
MVLTTLTLAAGLLAIPEPQAELQKGWIVELHGYTYHSGAKPKGWVIEWQGFTKHRGQGEQPKEMQPNRPKARQEVIIQAVYVDDLSTYFNQLRMQKQDGAVEGLYVDDLPAFFKSLKKRNP